MILKELFNEQGSWLFKHRSYLPTLLIPLVVIGIFTSQFKLSNSLYANLYNWFCVVISTLGFYIRIITIGQVPRKTSGRNTKKQIAETLNTTGIYSIFRHPLYVGNFLMWLGIFFYTRSIWTVIVFILIFWLYYERIMYTEEAFLSNKFGDVYDKWAKHTPAVIPKFSLHCKSTFSFSMKNVFKREYSGFLGLVISFVLVANLNICFAVKKITYSRESLIILLISIVIYAVIRSLKKFTKIFNEKGR
ncbi:MAG: isoprenylcysteine carboxylmethyltransferase family protein [Candidatus Cloacimonetes bacterium]|jgi:protein-S-isoprenylcysteine O-methyltransferase Ste14|nr:isoprenylcysteine carboxylmethyltransferase family protein [Candidatus Cloacimonadota bacterium]